MLTYMAKWLNDRKVKKKNCLSEGRKKCSKSGLFSLTRKRFMDGGGVFEQLRISLADTTHVAITVSEIAYFNLSVRLNLKKCFPNIFLLAFTHPNK